MDTNTWEGNGGKDQETCRYYKTPDGREFWIPICAEELKPRVDQFFKTVNLAYKFYFKYVQKCGFDVRRGPSNKDKNHKLRYKYIVCSHADSSQSNDTYAAVDKGMSKRRRTASQRCECKAKITLKYCGDTGFTVFAFTEEHNHPLADEETKKFLRCNRQLTFEDKNFIYDASKVNIGPKRSFSVLKEFVGSYENIGATAIEFKNFGHDLKARIGEHDADMILDKFKRIKEQSNGSFYYEYKVDSAGHLTGLFWADAIGRRNYSVFGDALSFDPTYRTNRYNMVFVPFTCVDNHWHNVTFAAALLEKEDHHNFMWALKAFEKEMDHIPKCVITDQDNAISKALELVWKDTRHSFCMWHIMNKLPGKVRPSLASDKKFMGKMKSLVWADHLTINEFEEGWNSVIEEYDLQDNTWLNDLYNIRADWIPAFFNDLEMAGLLRTTSRSESSNFYFQHFQQSGDTLVQFYSRYESAMDKQRYTNSQNKKDSQLIPKPYLQLPIEKDAGVVYTRQLFNFVQEEIVSGFLHTHIGDMNVVDDMKIFQIVDRLLNERVFEVIVYAFMSPYKISANIYYVFVS